MVFEKNQQPIIQWKDVLRDSKWREIWYRQEEAQHQEFFNQVADFQLFRTLLEQYPQQTWEQWLSRGYEPHFLPAVKCARGQDFPGWRNRPQDVFWIAGRRGEILRNDDSGELEQDAGYDQLLGEVVLIESTATPLRDFTQEEGGEFDANPWLQPKMQELRDQGKVQGFRDMQNIGTRFGISRTEWNDVIRPTLQKEISLPSTLRLERVIEANIIPQLFTQLARSADDKNVAFMHLEEYVGDGEHAFIGRAGPVGDANDVTPLSVVEKDGRSPGVAFRPIVVLRPLE